LERTSLKIASVDTPTVVAFQTELGFSMLGADDCPCPSAAGWKLEEAVPYL
jgi:hypothetical protein